MIYLICYLKSLYSCKLGWKDHENVIITKLLAQSHTPLTLHYHSAWNNLMTFSLNLIFLPKMNQNFWSFSNLLEVFCRGHCTWQCPGWIQCATQAHNWSGLRTAPQRRWLGQWVSLNSSNFKINSSIVLYLTEQQLLFPVPDYSAPCRSSWWCPHCSQGGGSVCGQWSHPPPDKIITIMWCYDKTKWKLFVDNKVYNIRILVTQSLKYNFLPVRV